jgi:hypothetical protein
MGEAIGIGFAIAKALLADGWKRVLADLAQAHALAGARLDASRTNATNHGPGLLRATVLKQARARRHDPRRAARRHLPRPPAKTAGAAVFLLDGGDAAIPGNFFGADGAAPASAGYHSNRE